MAIFTEMYLFLLFLRIFLLYFLPLFDFSLDIYWGFYKLGWLGLGVLVLVKNVPTQGEC